MLLTQEHYDDIVLGVLSNLSKPRSDIVETCLICHVI
jgi:hypothetical protein